MRRAAIKRVIRYGTPSETYVFTYENTAKNRAEMLRTIGRFASRPDLVFSWCDAAILSQQIQGERP